jgi:hypothetical protein
VSISVPPRCRAARPGQGDAPVDGAVGVFAHVEGVAVEDGHFAVEFAEDAFAVGGVDDEVGAEGGEVDEQAGEATQQGEDDGVFAGDEEEGAVGAVNPPPFAEEVGEAVFAEDG